MKNTITKTSLFFILELICRYLLFPLCTILLSIYISIHFIYKTTLSLNAIFCIAIFVMSIGASYFAFQLLHNNILEKIMLKTEKKLVDNLFSYETMYETQQYRLYINTNGNLGLITMLNPRVFQIIHSCKIQDSYVKVQYLSKDTVKGVGFILKVHNKSLYFPTFQTYHAFNVNDDAVKHGISTANYYVTLLKKSQKNAISLS